MSGARPAAALLLAALACAHAPDPMRYRLTGSGEHWDAAGSDRIFDDLQGRYAAYFELILDPSRTHLPDLRPLRDDLERQPADRHNYDALNALAIGYFELNYRAEVQRGGPHYLGDSTRAAKLAAVPWRAYGEVAEGTLRDAILDFFEDVAEGRKLESARTAPRLAATVDSLLRKETDPARRSRIQAIRDRLAAGVGNGAP